MARKSKIDWTALQSEWMVGSLSNMALAKKYGITDTAIRLKIKQEGWKRDDGEVYRQKVEAKVQEKAAASLRAELRGTKAKFAAEAEVSDLAAEVGAQVVECHRNDAKNARSLVNMLFGQLNVAASSREVLEELAEQLADGDDPAITQKMVDKLRSAIALPVHSSTVRDLTVALKNLVYIERGAFGLDKPLKDGSGAAAVAYDVSF